jgi:hypothetical protein
MRRSLSVINMKRIVGDIALPMSERACPAVALRAPREDRAGCETVTGELAVRSRAGRVHP